jgi:hypothetical protein
VITTDLWIDVESGTNIACDVRILDGQVEILIGSRMRRGDCLHLNLPDPETCTRLAEVITRGRDEFVAELQKQRQTGPA